MASKVAPEPTGELRATADSSSKESKESFMNESADGSFSKESTKKSFTKNPRTKRDAKASVRGMGVLQSVRGDQTGWKREEGPVHSQRGSGRGHELDGGGLTAGQGQLAQARDRNFDGVFIRCRDAITSIRETAKSATCCGDAFAELDDAGVRIHARLRFCSMLRTRLVAQLL